MGKDRLTSERGSFTIIQVDERGGVQMTGPDGTKSIQSLDDLPEYARLYLETISAQQLPENESDKNTGPETNQGTEG